MKRQPTEWKKAFANKMTDTGFISEIYKQNKQHNIKEASQSKNGQTILIDFSPKKTYRDQKSH